MLKTPNTFINRFKSKEVHRHTKHTKSVPKINPSLGSLALHLLVNFQILAGDLIKRLHKYIITMALTARLVARGRGHAKRLGWHLRVVCPVHLVGEEGLRSPEMARVVSELDYVREGARGKQIAFVHPFGAKTELVAHRIMRH